MAPLTDYEREREERIAKNKALLASLDIPKPISTSVKRSIKSAPVKSSKKRKQRDASVTDGAVLGDRPEGSRRTSARLQNKVRRLFLRVLTIYVSLVKLTMTTLTTMRTIGANDRGKTIPIIFLRVRKAPTTRKRQSNSQAIPAEQWMGRGMGWNDASSVAEMSLTLTKVLIDPTRKYLEKSLASKMDIGGGRGWKHRGMAAMPLWSLGYPEMRN